MINHIIKPDGDSNIHKQNHILIDKSVRMGLLMTSDVDSNGDSTMDFEVQVIFSKKKSFNHIQI